MNETQKQDGETIPESSAAKLAFWFAWIPLVGWMFYMPFAFLGLFQIGKGRTGFNLLGKGLTAVVFLSVLPIAGLTYWAELPSDCYPVLNKLTEHGRYSTLTDGQLDREEYYRFGQQFRAVTYGYHANGKKRSQATWVNGKLNGKSYYWFDNEQLRADEIFVNGKRNGHFTWYTRDGKLERSMDYTDGISQEQIDAAKKAGVEPVIEVDLGRGVKMRMIFIPPGEFMMGSTPEEIAKLNDSINNFYKSRLNITKTEFDYQSPLHKIDIKQGFYLSETEITQEQWQTTMYNNPSYFKENHRPVERVSWDATQEFIKKLNGTGKGTFRLPSESEWEYACRARTSTLFSFGNEYNDLGDYAWYWDNSGRLSHRTSGKKANNYGLYDMHGNVQEWCEDDWHENYINAPKDGCPWIDKTRGYNRVLRGGSWGGSSRLSCSAHRYWISHATQDFNFGFRLAVDLPTAKPQDKKP